MELDKIKPEDLAQSLNLVDNITATFKAGEGAGASGSFFFRSADKKFIIKTMRGNEK